MSALRTASGSSRGVSDIADTCDEYHRLAQRRLRAAIAALRSGDQAPGRRCIYGRGCLDPHVDTRVVRRHGAAAARELPVQRFGRRFRGDIEVPAQRLAAGAVLPQRIGVATLPGKSLHQVALRALVRRLDAHQAFERRDGTRVVAACRALSRHSPRRGDQQTPQLATTFHQPLVECRRTRFESVEQHAGMTFDSARQRTRGTVPDQRAKLLDIAAGKVRIEHDGSRIASQSSCAGLREAAPQAGQRLAQARAGELGVRVLPEEPGKHVSRMRDARLQRQAAEQRLRLARDDAQLAAGAGADPQTPQQLDMKFRHARSRKESPARRPKG